MGVCVRRREPYLAAGAVLLAALCGCRRVEPSAPALTADALWRQAVEALDGDRADEAAELFRRSLAAADGDDRRRDAAIRLFAAGEVAAARALLNGRSAPSLAAVSDAIDLYAASPPAAHRGDPYVVAAIADALTLLRRPAEPTQPIEPVLLTPPDLANLTRLWQTWLMLADPDSADPAERPGRAMVLWAAMHLDVDVLAERGFIVHRPVGDNAAGWLAHLGSWPVATISAAEDVVDLGAIPSGPVAMYLATWDTSFPLTVSLEGEWVEQGFAVRMCSHPPLLTALLASLTDADLADGAVAARTAEEIDAVLALAEQLGRDGAVGFDGGVLTVVSPEVAQTDYVPRNDWLADLAGYVRYGRAALAPLVAAR